MQKKRPYILLIFLISLLTAFLAEKIISQQNFTLASQKSWHSLKRIRTSQFLSAAGTDEYMFERQSLAGEQLNLSSWFGHMDLVYKQLAQASDNLKFDFSLENEYSYFLVYLACRGTDCVAYRFSKDEIGSGIFLINLDGEFKKSQPDSMVTKRLVISKKFTFEKKNGRLFLNDDDIGAVPEAYSEFPVWISSGLEPVTVTRVQAGDFLNTDFSAPYSKMRFVFIFLGLMVVSSLLLLTFRGQFAPVLLGCCVVFTLVAVIFGFDRYYWSRQYIAKIYNPGNTLATPLGLEFEERRKSFFEQFKSNQAEEMSFLDKSEVPLSGYAGIQKAPRIEAHIFDWQLIASDGNIKFQQKVKEELELLAKQKNYRVGFLGGSQTWGAGAVTVKDSFPSLVIQQLQRPGRRVVGANFAHCGDLAFNIYKSLSLVSSFDPDLLIVNFGANDSETKDKQFLFYLLKINEWSKHHKAKILFSIEGFNHIENKASASNEVVKAPLIREFAKAYKFEVVSLNDYLNSPELRHSGIIWIDQIHFTNFGHRLAARFFSNVLSDNPQR